MSAGRRTAAVKERRHIVPRLFMCMKWWIKTVQKPFFFFKPGTFSLFCRASIRQRSRSQMSKLMPDSVSLTGELGPRAYSMSQADKSKVCIHSYVWECKTTVEKRSWHCFCFFFSISIAYADKSFHCLLKSMRLCECSDCSPRGGWGRGRGAGSSHQDPQVQHTWVALYAFWIRWGCHKRRSQPRLRSAVQSNPGGEVHVLLKHINHVPF